MDWSGPADLGEGSVSDHVMKNHLCRVENLITEWKIYSFTLIWMYSSEVCCCFEECACVETKGR
jgi:hypothetical protein